MELLYCHLAVNVKKKKDLKMRIKPELDRFFLFAVEKNKHFCFLFCICEGYGDGFDDVIIQGDLDELRFVAFYTRYVFFHNNLE